MTLKNVRTKDGGSAIGEADAINLIQGSNVTLTVTHDTANDEIDITIASSGGGSGHTIREDGVDLTARTGLNFVDGIVASDDQPNDETDVNLDYGAAGYPLDVAAAESDGAAVTVPRSDHVHAHGSGYLPNAHHNESHSHDGVDGSGTVAHADATGQGTDDHHNQVHAIDGADHTGSIAHSATSGQTANDHHNQSHADSDHTGPSRFIPVTFTKTGALATGTGQTRWYNDTGTTLTIDSTRGAVGTAPTDADILVDVNIDNTSIWNATQANRITIAATTNTDQGGAPDDDTLANGEFLTVDVDQVGATEAGQDLTVTIWLRA